MKLLGKILKKINYLKISKSKKEFLKFKRFQNNKKYINESIEKILSFSTKNIYYYNNLPPKLSSFPIIDKELIKHIKVKNLISNKLGVINNTSGSSGKQFSFYVEPDFFGREWILARYIWSKFIEDYNIKEPVINIRTFVPKNDEDIFYHDKFQNFYYVSPYHISNSYFNKIKTYILNTKSRILRGYPSSIFLFSEICNLNNYKFNSIKLIAVSSEMLISNYEKSIKKAFPNALICNQYGQNEGVLSLYKCKYGNWHNIDYYGYMEINNKNELIGTSLLNYKQPFIRYNTKDLVKKTKIIKCSCGDGYTSGIKEILGRSDDWLFHYNGNKVSTVNFSSAFKSYPEIYGFQIVQENKKNLIFKYLSSHQISLVSKSKIKSEIYSRLGKLKLEFKRVNSFVRDKKTGKIKTVIRNISNE